MQELSDITAIYKMNKGEMPLDLVLIVAGVKIFSFQYNDMKDM